MSAPPGVDRSTVGLGDPRNGARDAKHRAMRVQPNPFPAPGPTPAPDPAPQPHTPGTPEPTEPTRSPPDEVELPE